MTDEKQTPDAPRKPSGAKHNIAEHSGDAKGNKDAVKDRTDENKS